jgi:hypothetical protein
MKILILSLLGCFYTVTLNAQTTSGKLDATKPVKKVEASCGQCNFGLKEKGCSLAVRIEDKAYFVEGTSIDEHGDAHAEDGFCETIRKAEVQGAVVNNKFKVTYFKLLPVKKN